MVGVGSGKVLSSPNSAPLTYKDGTALALSCMADYGAPVFPFLAVGGYKGKLRPPQEASEWTYGAGVMGKDGGGHGDVPLPGSGRVGGGLMGTADLPILHRFSVTYCIFRQPCSGSLALCLEPQVLPLTERGK